MQSQVDLLRDEIARRIRPVLPNTPEDEFGRLVARMAELQHRYEKRVQLDFLRFNGTR